MREEETTKTRISLKALLIKKVKYPLMLRYVLNGRGWKITIRRGVHNHVLAKDLVSHDILSCWKPEERLFMNDI